MYECLDYMLNDSFLLYSPTTRAQWGYTKAFACCTEQELSCGLGTVPSQNG